MQKSTNRFFTEVSDAQKIRQLEKAKVSCRQALKTAPRDVGCMHTLGLIDCQLGNPSEGKKWFLKALAIEKNSPDLFCHYGLALMEEGAVGEAVKAFKQCTALAPHHLEANYHLAAAFDQLGRTDEAIASYQYV
jgi:Flp pilus assembly protein TadD